VADGTIILDERWAVHFPVALADLADGELPRIVQAIHVAAKAALYARCPWHELPLSQRAITILQRNNLSTIGAVIACRPSRIRCLAGCGRQTREEIITVFAAAHIELPEWRETHRAMGHWKKARA
jgi:DNA-directed RNA polymerase alpha subunit